MWAMAVSEQLRSSSYPPDAPLSVWLPGWGRCAAARIPAAGEVALGGVLTMNRSLPKALTRLTHITINTRHNGSQATLDAACSEPTEAAPLTAPADSRTHGLTP